MNFDKSIEAPTLNAYLAQIQDLQNQIKTTTDAKIKMSLQQQIASLQQQMNKMKQVQQQALQKQQQDLNKASTTANTVANAAATSVVQ